MSTQPDGTVRVVLRPIGSSLPLGLSGLAIASLVVAGFNLGWVPTATAHEVGLLVLVTVVPMQGLACVFALLARDGATGGLMGLQAATWAALGAALLVSPPGTATGALGLALVAGGALIALSATTLARAKVLPGIAMGLSGVHFVLTAVYELGGPTPWRHAAGIVSLVVVALAGYGAWATELEDMADRTILPTGRRGAARAAVSGPLRDQTAGVAHEPGVRRQL